MIIIKMFIIGVFLAVIGPIIGLEYEKRRARKEREKTPTNTDNAARISAVASSIIAAISFQ